MANTGNIKYSGNSGGGLDFESQLWATADKMRGHKDASEYKHVCLDLIISNIGFNESAAKSKDVLERVYECFLGNFASAEGKGGGEFYTPQCVAQVLVTMLEPYKGRVFDPCCGSGGLFVQSGKLVEDKSWFVDVTQSALSKGWRAATLGEVAENPRRGNWNDISRYKVALPPKELAADFTERLRPLIERIIANIHESRMLATLRDALLPKLLSGELRLPTVSPAANEK
jgi:hypothetical protein